MKKHLCIMIIFILLAIFLVALSTSSYAATVKAVKLTLEHSKIDLDINKDMYILANISPSNTTDKTIFWSSSDTKVVTVNSKGKIKALKKGTATIIARTTNGKSASCKVTVVIPVKSVSLNQVFHTMRVGESFQLSASVAPNDATNKKVKWKTSNSKIAIVTSTGIVMAKKQGTVKITAESDNGKKKTCEIKVKSNVTVPVNSVILNADNCEMYVGDKIQLSTSVTPYNATDKKIKWKTSDSKTATVTTTGLVMAKKSGKVTITATSTNGKTDTCKITIKKAKLSIAEHDVVVAVGETMTLTTLISPTNTSKKTISWSSTDPKVVTVDSKGKIKAIKRGRATIIAKAADCKPATCEIIVFGIPVSYVKLDRNSYTMRDGEDVQLSVAVFPKDATDKKVKWTTSDSKTAIVTTTGFVVAKKPGTVTITATSDNGKRSTCKITINEVKAESLKIEPEYAILDVGETKKLNVVISPANTSNKTISWSSNNKSIVTVDSKGKIKAINEGNTSIIAKTTNGKIATFDVTVYTKVKSITITPSYTNLTVGKTVQLNVSVTPSNAKDKKIDWKSSDSKVATVDSTGLVTAKASGTVTITAMNKSNIKQTCKIAVYTDLVAVNQDTLQKQVPSGIAKMNFSTTLRKNSTNNDVVKLVGILKGQKLLTGTANTNTFDSTIEQAVKYLQKLLNVKIDGVVGADLKAAYNKLYASDGSPKPKPSKNAKLLSIAEKCYDFVRKTDFEYYKKGSLKITEYGEGKNNNKTSSTKGRGRIDCSAYVCWVLYEYGFKDIKEQYGSGRFAELANKYGWEIIKKKDAESFKAELVGGDILVAPGEHVEIYRGNETSYSCGNNSDGTYNKGPASIPITNFKRYSFAIRIN